MSWQSFCEHKSLTGIAVSVNDHICQNFEPESTATLFINHLYKAH